MSRSLQTPMGGPSSGSQTESNPRQPTDSSVHTQGTLRLRAENDVPVRGNDQDGSTSRRIRWSEDVVDNEGMGKKSSKGACSSSPRVLESLTILSPRSLSIKSPNFSAPGHLNQKCVASTIKTALSARVAQSRILRIQAQMIRTVTVKETDGALEIAATATTMDSEMSLNKQTRGNQIVQNTMGGISQKSEVLMPTRKCPEQIKADENVVGRLGEALLNRLETAFRGRHAWAVEWYIHILHIQKITTSQHVRSYCPYHAC